MVCAADPDQTWKDERTGFTMIVTNRDLHNKSIVPLQMNTELVLEVSLQERWVAFEESDDGIVVDDQFSE